MIRKEKLKKCMILNNKNYKNKEIKYNINRICYNNNQIL